MKRRALGETEKHGHARKILPSWGKTEKKVCDSRKKSAKKTASQLEERGTSDGGSNERNIPKGVVEFENNRTHREGLVSKGRQN